MVSIDALTPQKESEDKIKVVSSVEEIAEDIKKDLQPEKKSIIIKITAHKKVILSLLFWFFWFF